MVVIRRLFLAAIFSATLVVGWMFAARNGASVDVDLLALQVPEIKLWLALLGAFAAGILLAGAMGMFALAKAGMVARRYRRTVVGLESEVHQLRNLPLASGELSPPAADTPVGLDEVVDIAAKTGTGA